MVKRHDTREGMYDPRFEHDACGVGLLVNVKGIKSHRLVEQGLQVLEHMVHRGAEGADPKTGDGAGIMVQIPHEFILLQGVPVPEKGRYGTGLVFMPRDAEQQQIILDIMEREALRFGMKLMAVRDMPVNNEMLGEVAREAEPAIKQIFVSDEETTDPIEIRLYLMRKSVERKVAESSEIEDKDDFYLNGFGMFGHRWGHTLTDFSSTVPDMWNSNTQLSRQRGDNRGGHVEFGYKHSWSDTHTLDMNVAWNRWGGPSWNSYREEEVWNDDPSKNAVSYREQTMPIGVNSWEAKVDYTKQLTGWLKLETGFDGNYSHEDTPNSTMSGTSPTDMTVNKALYNRFIYSNNVSALYATLGGKVKDFSFSAGLRSESWQVRARSLAYDQKKEDVPEFSKNFFALFPSVFLSYSLPHDNEIQINYTRRIRRPWGGQLNSFQDISDPTNISYGNPELEPQYSNAFELNYLKSWTWHMLSLSAYVRTSDNMMNRISYFDNDVIYTTWANVAKSVNSGVELVGKNSFFGGKLDLTTTVNLYNNHISAWHYTVKAFSGNTVELSGDKQNSFAWDARMLVNLRLPWGLSFQATGRYSSEHKEAQGSHAGGWSVDAGLRKVAGNWSISLNCRDIFDSRRFKSTVNGIDYFQRNERWRAGRQLRLTIKYSFGNMKAKPNKNMAEPMGGSGYDGGGDE